MIVWRFSYGAVLVLVSLLFTPCCFGMLVHFRITIIILVDKKGKSCVVVDIAVPGDCRVREKELEKIEKY